MQPHGNPTARGNRAVSVRFGDGRHPARRRETPIAAGTTDCTSASDAQRVRGTRLRLHLWEEPWEAAQCGRDDGTPLERPFAPAFRAQGVTAAAARKRKNPGSLWCKRDSL